MHTQFYTFALGMPRKEKGRDSQEQKHGISCLFCRTICYCLQRWKKRCKIIKLNKKEEKVQKRRWGTDGQKGFSTNRRKGTNTEKQQAGKVGGRGGRGGRGGTCVLRQRSSHCCFSSCVCSTVSLRPDSWVMSDWKWVTGRKEERKTVKRARRGEGLKENKWRRKRRGKKEAR